MAISEPVGDPFPVPLPLQAFSADPNGLKAQLAAQMKEMLETPTAELAQRAGEPPFTVTVRGRQFVIPPRKTEGALALALACLHALGDSRIDAAMVQANAKAHVLDSDGVVRVKPFVDAEAPPGPVSGKGRNILVGDAEEAFPSPFAAVFDPAVGRAVALGAVVGRDGTSYIVRLLDGEPLTVPEKNVQWITSLDRLIDEATYLREKGK